MTVPVRIVIPTGALTPDPREVAARLKDRGEPLADETVRAEWEALKQRIAAVASFVRTGVTFPEENAVDLGFGPIGSSSLSRCLTGCREAFLLAVTLGSDVDRYLMRLSFSSPARHFIADGLASALTESACDFAEAGITGGLSCRPRFSPGYGDLPLSIQPDVLAATDAGRRLGITLNPAFIMSPSKSVTAIIGILP